MNSSGCVADLVSAEQQRVLVEHSPQLCVGCRNPLLCGDEVSGLFRSGQLDVVVAAVSCCSDPAALRSVARSDKRAAVADALLANPATPAVVLWHAAVWWTGSSEPARRRRNEALRLAEAKLRRNPCSVFAELDEHSDEFRAACAGAAKFISSFVADARTLGFEVVEAALGFVAAHGNADMVSTAVERVCAAALDHYSLLGADNSAELRALCWRYAPKVAAARFVRALRGQLDERLRTQLVAEIVSHGVVADHVPELVRVFASHPSPVLAEAVGTVRNGWAAVQHDAVLCDTLCGVELLPSGTAAGFPATSATVVRALCDAGIEVVAWPLALALVPARRGECTASDVVNMVCASNTPALV